MRSMSSDDRLPRGDIPHDFACRDADCTQREAFKNEAGYRMHAWNKHKLKYTKRPSKTLADLKNLPGPETKEEISELSTWEMLGIAMHEMYGMSQQDVVDEIRGGKGKATLAKVLSSPAGKKYREEIKAKARDPDYLVKSLMSSTQPYIFAHWLNAFETASEHGNVEAVHKMAKEIGLAPALAQTQGPSGPAITIQLGSADLSEIPVITSYEVVEIPDDPE